MTNDNLNLRELIIIVLKRWRMLIVFSLVIALLLGGYQCVSGFLKLYDTNELANQQSAYNDDLQLYEQKKDNIEQSIDNLTEQADAIPDVITDLDHQIEQISDYIENSPLMKVDPQAKPVERVELIVDSGYQIMPGMDYQNIDPLEKLIAAYELAAHNDDIYTLIQQRVKLDINPQYLDELIRVEAMENGIIVIECYYEDANVANTIVNTVSDQLLAQTDKITLYLGAHTINRYNETHFTMVDEDLKKLQYDTRYSLQQLRKQRSDNLSDIAVIDASLSDFQNQLKALSPPENVVTSPITIVKSLIKFGVVGFAGGMILAIFIILFLDSIDNRIGDELKLIRKYPIRLIGSLPIKMKKRIRSFDRFVQRLEGKIESFDDRTASLLASCVRLVTQLDPDKQQVIVCTGSCDPADITAAIQALSVELKNKGYLQTTLVPGGSILSSAETVAALNTCDAILLCEKINTSTYTAVEQEMLYLKAAEKPILGILFV